MEVSFERRVVPLVVLRWNYISVGVEEDGWEGRICAGPFEEHKGLALDKLKDLRMEGEGFGLGENEVSGSAIVGRWVSGVDLKVLPES